MKIKALYVFLIFIISISADVNETQVTDSTPTKDSLLLEIELLQKQIDLNDKKISLLQQLRSYYIKNNMTVPVRSRVFLLTSRKLIPIS
jgi:hypothetical protein